jgi:hypothetical protein
MRFRHAMLVASCFATALVGCNGESEPISLADMGGCYGNASALVEIEGNVAEGGRVRFDVSVGRTPEGIDIVFFKPGLGYALRDGAPIISENGSASSVHMVNRGWTGTSFPIFSIENGRPIFMDSKDCS